MTTLAVSNMEGEFQEKSPKTHERAKFLEYTFDVFFGLFPLPSNSGKWKFIGSPTKNVEIPVVTITGKGDNLMYCPKNYYSILCKKRVFWIPPQH